MLKTRWLKTPGVVALGAVAVLWLAGSAAAQQFTFDDGARYKAEVDATSSDTIPPGTQITTANWKQYQNFLPVGIQALYSGQYGFKIGDGPDFAMNVGATIDTPLPKEVQSNAEKYGHQAKLVQLPSGGYGVQGYVAGMPFVNPSEPDLGTKIMFDLWYDFWPFLISYNSHFFIEDRYGNMTPEESIATTWQLMHLSDSPVSDRPAVRGGLLSQHPRPAVAPRTEQIHHRVGPAARRSQRGAGNLRVPALLAPAAAAVERGAMLADPWDRLGAGRQQRRYRLPIGKFPRQLPG